MKLTLRTGIVILLLLISASSVAHAQTQKEMRPNLIVRAALFTAKENPLDGLTPKSSDLFSTVNSLKSAGKLRILSRYYGIVVSGESLTLECGWQTPVMIKDQITDSTGFPKSFLNVTRFFKVTPTEDVGGDRFNLKVNFENNTIKPDRSLNSEVNHQSLATEVTVLKNESLVVGGFSTEGVTDVNGKALKSTKNERLYLVISVQKIVPTKLGE